MPVASPYALFRAADLPWGCSRQAPPPPAVIQGELFPLPPALLLQSNALQPSVLPVQPHRRARRAATLR